jgi:hypothetical protein
MQDLAFLLLMNIELSGENRRTGVANKCSAGQNISVLTLVEQYSGSR